MAELFGKYRGIVVDATSPTGQGRLQVDVPAVGVTAVWAEASLPPVPTSLLKLPEPGATVWVEFEGGDVDLPIWTGATWGSSSPPAELTLETFGTLTLRASTVMVESPMSSHSGVLKSQTLVTDSVISPLYTPGAGNVM